MTVAAEARKWGKIFAIYAQDALIYRAVAFIWLLTDTIPTLVMPMLWIASYNGRSQIAGYTPSQMTAYYLVFLGVTNLVTCHVMWEIGVDIKEGRFAAYLLRPFSYMTMQYLGYIAWRMLRTALFIPIFFFAAFLFGKYMNWGELHFNGLFVLAVFLGHLVSFFITYAFGLLALYFVETRSLFQFWYMPMMLFNGNIAPLALFPPGVRQVAELLPFRYTVAFPTEILLGRLTTEEIVRGFGLQVVWIVVGWLLGVVLWKFGIKRFTGVGQ